MRIYVSRASQASRSNASDRAAKWLADTLAGPASLRPSVRAPIVVGDSDAPAELAADRLATEAGLGVSTAAKPVPGGFLPVAPVSATTHAAIRHALSTPGEPLSPRMRRLQEHHLGVPLGDVRLHRDAAADRAASMLRATAFAVGHDIVLRRSADLTLPAAQATLTHEIAHVAQQRHAAGASLLQRQTRPAPAVAATEPRTPSELPRGRTYRVVIVGAPGQAEVRRGHPYQFADAAAQDPTGQGTVWLVEQTGYDLGS